MEGSLFLVYIETENQGTLETDIDVFWSIRNWCTLKSNEAMRVLIGRKKTVAPVYADFQKLMYNEIKSVYSDLID